MTEPTEEQEMLAKQLVDGFLRSKQGKRFMSEQLARLLADSFLRSSQGKRFISGKCKVGKKYTTDTLKPLALWEKICTVMFLPVTVPLILILYVPFEILQWTVFFACWGWVSLWRFVSKKKEVK